MKEMMWEALFQRAHDDDYGVLLAILSVKSLVNSPFPERVFKMLSTIISKSINTITTGLNSIVFSSVLDYGFVIFVISLID